MSFPKPKKKKKKVVRRFISRISPKRRAVLEEYHRLRTDFLRLHPFCQVCARRDLKQRRSEEIHHLRGRAGSLMLDRRFWMAACSRCHDWCHNSMDQARKLGCLCQIGDWNKPVR